VALQALDEVYLGEAELRVSQRRPLEQWERKFLVTGLSFYEKFAQNNRTNSPLMRWQTGRAYRRVGNIQHELGHNDKAEPAFREAMSRLEKLAEEFPAEPKYRRELVNCYHWLGHVLKITSRPQEAEPLLRQNLAASLQLVAEYPTVTDYRGHLRHAYYGLGDAFYEQKKLPEAVAAYLLGLNGKK